MFRSEYSELFVSTNITCITDVSNAAKTKYRKTPLGVFAKKSACNLGCLTKCENVQRIRVINAFAKLQAKPCNNGSRKCVETKLVRKNEGKTTRRKSPFPSVPANLMVKEEMIPKITLYQMPCH